MVFHFTHIRIILKTGGTYIKNYNLSFLIRTIRVNANLTQAELAKKANISQSSLSRIENGYQNSNVNDLICILTVLNIHIPSFFEKAIELDKTTKHINKDYNKIMLHHRTKASGDIHLIHDELLNFRKLFSTLKKDQIFDVTLDVKIYIQLPQIYPEYFDPIDVNLLQKETFNILKQKIWFKNDYYFIANTIPFLTKKPMESILNHVTNINFHNLNTETRRSFYVILENLTDHYLVHYQEYEPNYLKEKLLQLFKYWGELSTHYPIFENRMMLAHNQAMFKILMKIGNKTKIINKCKKRNHMISEAGLKSMSVNLMKETKNYENGIFGNLNLDLNIN